MSGARLRPQQPDEWAASDIDAPRSPAPLVPRTAQQHVLALQRTAGNAAVARLLARQSAPPAATAAPQTDAAPASTSEAQAPSGEPAAAEPPRSDTIVYDGVELSTSEPHVERRLRDLYPTRGLDGVQAFADAVATRMIDDVHAAPDRYLGERRLQSVRALTEQEEDWLTRVRDTTAKQYRWIQVTNREFLDDFEHWAHTVMVEVLDASKERAEKERERYGIRKEGKRVLGIEYDASFSMANNGDAQALVRAASELKQKLAQLRTMAQLRELGRATGYGEEGYMAARVDYDAARARHESAHPVLAAFNLDPARGSVLEKDLDDLVTSPGAILAETLGSEIDQRLENIESVRKRLASERDLPWRLPGIVSLTRDRLAVPPRSVNDLLVRDRVEQRQSTDRITTLALAVVAFGLGLLAAVPTVGASVAATATLGASAIGMGMGLASLQEARFQQAASGSDFAQARAISQEAPDWLWVAVDLMASGLDVHGAAAAFKILAGLRREALMARMAHEAAASAATEQRVTRTLGRLRAEGNARKTGLGERLESELRASSVNPEDIEPDTLRAIDPRAMPEGTSLEFGDYRSAHYAYRNALRADPSREMGIWRNRKENRYFVGYGDKKVVVGPSAEELWELVKHHHPNKKETVDLLSRIPSGPDFKDLRPRNAAAGTAPVKSMITWYDESNRLRYSTFGHDPASMKPYWVRYADADGAIQIKRFRDPPWLGEGFAEYRRFVDKLEKVEQAVRAAASAP